MTIGYETQESVWRLPLSMAAEQAFLTQLFLRVAPAPPSSPLPPLRKKVSLLTLLFSSLPIRGAIVYLHIYIYIHEAVPVPRVVELELAGEAEGRPPQLCPLKHALPQPGGN